MKTATGKSLVKAYDMAVKRIVSDDRLLGAATSAGFIIPDGQKLGEREGFQVFVRVVRFSEKLLTSKPFTGGLKEGMKWAT